MSPAIRVTLVAAAGAAASTRPRFGADGEIDLATPATVGLSAAEQQARAWCGSDRRSVATAAALGLAAAPADDLGAWSVGRWVGRSVEDVAGEEPDAFSRWRRDPTVAPPDGESLDDLLRRVRDWLDGLLQTGGRHVAVADSAVVTAALVHALAGTGETFWRVSVPPLWVARISSDGGVWRFTSLQRGHSGPPATQDSAGEGWP